MATSKGISAFGGVPSASRILQLARAVVPDPSLELDGAVVDRLCDRIHEAADLLADLPLVDGPTDRAEAYHYLLTMLAYAVDAGVLHADALQPMFSAPQRNHLLDWGAASPDGVYRKASLRDDRAYRISGRLGNAEYLTLDLRTGGAPFALVRDDIEADDDGAFEVFLGGDPRPRNWWAMPPGTEGVLTREFFGDWGAAERSHLRIDCLDGELAPRPEHNARRLQVELDAIGDWVLDGAVRFWAERSQEALTARPNAFAPELARTETKLPVHTYAVWDLAPDEALLVEVPDPDARFWALQLASSLWSTLDYANRLTTFNLVQAEPDADGTCRFVLAHEDPGVHNWLDTTGLRCGVLILRFCSATAAQIPRTEVVASADIGRLLPDARRLTHDERLAQIAERREGVARMVCD